MDGTTPSLSTAQAAAAEQLLLTAPFGYLAMSEPPGTGTGSPYVVPLNFAYVAGDGASARSGRPEPDGRVYFHTGEGRKTRALAADPRACLALTAAVGFEQGAGPCDDGFSYRSLLVWGRVRRLEDAAEREAALRAIVAKYDPEAAGTPFDEGVFSRTLLFELIIEATGYKERKPRITAGGSIFDSSRQEAAKKRSPGRRSTSPRSL
jgi:nitroimidazol reductase NimA-like FMN-containing flavoprotein (pyridoxamine 5'-phosphate oxidase superfamily)